MPPRAPFLSEVGRSRSRRSLVIVHVPEDPQPLRVNTSEGPGELLPGNASITPPPERDGEFTLLGGGQFPLRRDFLHELLDRQDDFPAIFGHIPRIRLGQKFSQPAHGAEHAQRVVEEDALERSVTIAGSYRLQPLPSSAARYPGGMEQTTLKAAGYAVTTTTSATGRYGRSSGFRAVRGVGALNPPPVMERRTVGRNCRRRTGRP